LDVLATADAIFGGFSTFGSDFFLKLSGSATFSNVPLHLL